MYEFIRKTVTIITAYRGGQTLLCFGLTVSVRLPVN